ncbi:hypothetical protein ACH5RR_028502 [Cinchona calisaya]|uniref:O-methyltransferase C-terminal domain-containing protein n=1 Tax=Cinchona calisaya TaxID=153742 RepID=A0ABD2YQC8_9GENT
MLRRSVFVLYIRSFVAYPKFVKSGLASARLISSLVIKNWKDIFLGLNSLVDVGGGTGTLAEAIADAFPHLNSAVLDLPHVVGGDMFAATPPTDAVLLKVMACACECNSEQFTFC